MSVPQEHSHLVVVQNLQEYGVVQVGLSEVEVVLAVAPRRRHKPPSSWTERSCCMGSDDCILSCVSCRLNKT